VKVARAIAVAILVFIIYIIYTGSITLYDIVTGLGASIIVATLLSSIVIENWRNRGI